MKILKMQRELTEKELIALNIIRRLGGFLIRRGLTDAIRDEYIAGRTAREIANQYIPEKYLRSNSIGESTIFYVLQIVMSPEEKERVGEEHKTRSRRKAGLAALKKLKEEKKGFFNPQTLREALRAAILARGDVEWSEEERGDLEVLTQDETYFRKRGPAAGLPDFRKITEILNQRYHKGQQIRTREKVATYTRFMRRQGRAICTREQRYRALRLASSIPTILSPQEKEDCLAIKGKPEFIYQEGPNKGKNNLVKIAQYLNDKHHGGQSFRTSIAINNCYQDVRRREKKAND